MEIDHVGYLTRDIKASITYFQNMGYQVESDIIYDVPEGAYEGRNILICFLRNGAYRIELVQPYDQSSVVSQTIKRQGEGPYHICYRTHDLQRKMAELKMEGFVIIKDIQKAVAFHGAEVAFLYKKNVGLIELLEE